jgi:hypothetical protein
MRNVEIIEDEDLVKIEEEDKIIEVDADLIDLVETNFFQ